VQQHGRADAEFEILVQLPGVDDPGRVKEIIGTAAVAGHLRSEGWTVPHAGSGGMAKHGGVLPLQHQAGERSAARRTAPGTGIFWHAILS